MKIKIDFLALCFWGSLFLTHAKKAQVILLAAIIHELGHLLASLLCRIPILRFRIGILGARLTTKSESYSYLSEILLCAGGPLINLLCAFLAHSLLPVTNECQLFVQASLTLGLFNLLPIRTLDGGRIVESLLLCALSPHTTDIITALLSFLSLFLLWIFSVYALFCGINSLSLFVFSIGLFTALFLKKD